VSVLDELREAMQQDIDHTPGHEETDEGYREGVSDALLRLAQFEAAHPGLREVITCDRCARKVEASAKVGSENCWGFRSPETGYCSDAKEAEHADD
jgi:hypothetical protein